MIKRLLSNFKKKTQPKTTDPQFDDTQVKAPEAAAVTKELDAATTPVETETVGYSSPPDKCWVRIISWETENA